VICVLFLSFSKQGLRIQGSYTGFRADTGLNYCKVLIISLRCSKIFEILPKMKLLSSDKELGMAPHVFLVC